MTLPGYKVGSIEVIRGDVITYRGMIQTPNGTTHVLESGPELATKAEACTAADKAIRELFWKRGTPVLSTGQFDTVNN